MLVPSARHGVSLFPVAGRAQQSIAILGPRQRFSIPRPTVCNLHSDGILPEKALRVRASSRISGELLT
jgi:hypothetical protein